MDFSGRVARAIDSVKSQRSSPLSSDWKKGTIENGKIQEKGTSSNTKIANNVKNLIYLMTLFLYGVIESDRNPVLILLS